MLRSYNRFCDFWNAQKSEISENLSFLDQKALLFDFWRAKQIVLLILRPLGRRYLFFYWTFVQLIYYIAIYILWDNGIWWYKQALPIKINIFLISFLNWLITSLLHAGMPACKNLFQIFGPPSLMHKCGDAGVAKQNQRFWRSKSEILDQTG